MKLNFKVVHAHFETILGHVTDEIAYNLERFVRNTFILLLYSLHGTMLPTYNWELGTSTIKEIKLQAQKSILK